MANPPSEKNSKTQKFPPKIRKRAHNTFPPTPKAPYPSSLQLHLSSLQFIPMSTSSVRRLKDRGGAGGKVVAPKPSTTLTPISEKSSKNFAGKENSKAISRVPAPSLQKPAIRVIPPMVDRRSTSSVPRGRSSSPFGFTRSTKSPESKIGKLGLNREKGVNGFRVLEQSREKKGVILNSKVKDLSLNGVLEQSMEQISVILNSKVKDLSLNGSKSSESKIDKLGLNGFRVSEQSREKKGVILDLNGKDSSLNGSKSLESKIDKVGLNGFRVSEQSREKKGVLLNSNAKDLSLKGSRVDIDVKSILNLGENGEKGLLDSNGTSSVGNWKKDGNLSSSIVTSSKIDVEDGGFKGSSVKDRVNSSKRVPNIVKLDEKLDKGSKCDAIRRRENGFDLDSKELGKTCSNDVRILKVLKEEGLTERSGRRSSVNKYQRELHEKLAFLEGRVKRIATDIKLTKEIMDMNNPDAAREILSDIQVKISGIEKDMGSVLVESVSNVGFTKTEESDAMKTETAEKIAIVGFAKTEESDVIKTETVKKIANVGFAKTEVSDVMEAKAIEKIQCKLDDGVKGSVKGLNIEELEARLFPHHKLLRDRTSLRASLGSSQSNQPHVVELDCKVNQEEKTPSSFDENAIALEFLASLNKDQNMGSEPCESIQMGDSATSSGETSNGIHLQCDDEVNLTTDERLEEFDAPERGMTVADDAEDSSMYKIKDIGRKASTGGWFVCDGESVLLAHNDSSCSFHDIINSEEKSVYKPPASVSPNTWRDCWVIRATGVDGSSTKYVVAASAGNTMDSGFCSWDFYNGDVKAFHVESGTGGSRTVLGALPNNNAQRRKALSLASDNQQWWYKPCGPLVVSTASSLKGVKIYDIRDGEKIMDWEVSKPVSTMEFSSPLQWRNRGEVLIAEAEVVSLWDVSSLSPKSLASVLTSGRISAFHVNNTDAELGGGVRQRLSSSEAVGNDGVFCTADYITVLDFRNPSGIAMKIPKFGINALSIFSRGDSIYLGCTNPRSSAKKQARSQIQQFSLRKQSLFTTYALSKSNGPTTHSSITQVWGNSNLVMGVSQSGLFVFDALKDDDRSYHLNVASGNQQEAREIIGPDNLYSPSFDYAHGASRFLLISRDRQASQILLKSRDPSPLSAYL